MPDRAVSPPSSVLSRARPLPRVPGARIAALCGLLLGALLGAGSCGGSDGSPTDAAGAGSGDARPVLRIGLEAKYPPFETTDASGAPVGFDVDLARALAEDLGRRAEFRDLAFDALLPELQAGRIDCVCSAMTRLPERAEKVSFTRPYVLTRMGVLVGTAKAAHVKEAKDLDDAAVTVAVQRGTSGESKAKEAFPKATVRPFDTEVDAAEEVASGRAHAFVYDMVSVRKLAEKAGDRVRVLPGDLGSEEYAIAFPKGSPLTERADAFLDRAAAPGGLLHTLQERWKPAVEIPPPGTR